MDTTPVCVRIAGRNPGATETPNQPTLVVGIDDMHHDNETDTDHLFHVLRRAPRRHALTLLQSYDELTLADLADEIAVQTHDDPLTAISADTVRDIYLSLYHTHIPVLVDAGFVTYDQEQDRVTLTDHGSAIDLEVIRSVASQQDEFDHMLG